MKEFLTESVKHGLTKDDAELGVAALGWTFGAAMAEHLENAPELTREDLMKTAWSEDSEAVGLMRPDLKLVTDGAEDPWLLESLRVVKRTDGEWVEASPLKDYNGESNDFVGG